MATTEIYTLSLHDALPISPNPETGRLHALASTPAGQQGPRHPGLKDRKSTRLNSSHVAISYAVFCLKKKTKSASENLSSIEMGKISVTSIEESSKLHSRCI